MSIVKRLSTTLFSRIDQVVGEIENHDALIKAAIDDQKKKIASARVQLAKIREGEKRTQNRIAELKVNAQRWASRAIDAAKTDEQKALACVQRRNDVNAQLAKLDSMLVEYRQTSQKISSDITQCEDALKSMIQKHELMRARQSSMDAKSAINDIGGIGLDELQTSFERWEVKLAQGEYITSGMDEMDVLEQEYVSQEQEASLKVELEMLLGKSKQENSDENA